MPTLPFLDSVRSGVLLTASALMSAAQLVSAAAIEVRDDSGRMVQLSAPARRIVSLAPHTTELLFEAGAGAHVVGVTDYSDWPIAAKKLPHTGSYQALDLERIIALRPDLVVGWSSGNSPTQIERLRALGIPIFLSEPRHSAQISENLRVLAQLNGNAAVGEAAARRFDARINALRIRYAARRPVRVFYQIWTEPLMTLNGAHMVSEAIALCGGQNVFAKLGPLAPTISEEAVLKAAPDAILTPSEAGQASVSALSSWKRWTQLPAVRYGNLSSVDGNFLNRSGPRFAEGVAQLCSVLDAARRRLSHH